MLMRPASVEQARGASCLLHEMPKPVAALTPQLIAKTAINLAVDGRLDEDILMPLEPLDPDEIGGCEFYDDILRDVAY